MSPDPLQPVTIPVLVEASFETAEGAWGFYPKKGGEPLTNVRVVRPKEIESKLRDILGQRNWELFRALDELVRVYERKDHDEDVGFEMVEALDKIRPFIKVPSGANLDVRGPKMWSAARWEYSQQMSTLLQDARLVMWWSAKANGPFSPGIYCPDLKTAAFVMRYVGGIRVCPYCERPFIPKKTTQVCCSTSHGVNFRTARSRDRKRRGEKTVKGKRKSRAPRAAKR